MKSLQGRVEKLEDKLHSNAEPIEEVTVDIIAMDGTVEESFIVKDGKLVK